MERSLVWQIIKKYTQFCMVGGSGVAVDMAVIYLLASPASLGWNLTVSKLLAAEVAIANNFLWNDIWTFRGIKHATRRRSARFAKFNLICVVGILLSVLLLNFQVYSIGLNIYVANLISIVAVSVWNFLLNLKYGWNTQPYIPRSPS